MELLEAIRQVKNPEVKQRLVDLYKRQERDKCGREAEIHNWLMLLVARTGYPTPQADVDRAAATLVLLADEDKTTREEVVSRAARHPDWTRRWVGELRAVVEARGMRVEVPGVEVPF